MANPKRERAPASGSCCARRGCSRPLGLSAVKRGEAWYCGSRCAQGLEPTRASEVAEEALYGRPRRFFRKRRPKELNS